MRRLIDQTLQRVSTDLFRERLELLLGPVVPAFDEEEELFVIDRKAVLHAFGQAVGLPPDDFIAQQPAASGHFEREP